MRHLSRHKITEAFSVVFSSRKKVRFETRKEREQREQRNEEEQGGGSKKKDQYI